MDESVLLARKFLSDHVTLGEGEARRLQRTLESFDITPGMYSFADAVTPAVEAEEYEFKDDAYDFTVYFLNFVGGSETVKEMDKRNMSLDGRKMNRRTKVHGLLYR